MAAAVSGQDELLCGSTHTAGRRHGVSGPRCGGGAEEAGGGQLGLPAQPGGPDRQHRRGPASDGRTGGRHPGEAGEERDDWTGSLPDPLDPVSARSAGPGPCAIPGLVSCVLIFIVDTYE